MFNIEEYQNEQRKKRIERLPQIEVIHSLKVCIIYKGAKVFSGDIIDDLRLIMISGRFSVTNITKFPTDLLEYKCNALFYETDGMVFNDIVETEVYNESMQFSLDTGTIECADFISTGIWTKC
jgi:hypothetical protein